MSKNENEWEKTEQELLKRQNERKLTIVHRTHCLFRQLDGKKMLSAKKIHNGLWPIGILERANKFLQNVKIIL